MLTQGEKCSMCNTAAWEWDVELGGNQHAYEPVHNFCRGCYLKHVAGEGEDAMPGTTIVLHPTGTREHALRLRRQRLAYERDRRTRLGDSRARKSRAG